MTHRSSSDIHHAAASGYAAQSAAYVSGRPDYPREIERWLHAALKLHDGSVAVDLGAGTGKFLPRLLSTGARIIAVEPVAQMRAQLASRFATIEVRPGTAEQLPLEAQSADAVVCAQAFHWFANPLALREIHRVLKPGGALGLIWNVRDDSVDWVAALGRIVNAHEGDAPRFHTGEWRHMFPAEGFGELREASFAHEHAGPVQQVVIDRMMSVSFIAALPENERAQVLEQIRALIASTPQLARQQTVSLPYRTRVFWCYRTS